MLDFSDDWEGLKKLSKNKSQMIEYKVGTYISVGIGMTGKPKLRQMTPKEMAEIDIIDSEPCDCVICTKRRENAIAVPPAAGLRSGEKLG